MIALTSAQHQHLLAALSEELRHQLECRDLEDARASGRVSRLELTHIRHTAKLDADTIARKVLDALPALDAEICASAARLGQRTLEDLLRAARAADSQPPADEDYLDSAVTPWVARPRR